MRHLVANSRECIFINSGADEDKEELMYHERLKPEDQNSI